MESQRQNNLFSWIHEQTASNIEYQGKRFQRHFEANATTASRLRIVYQCHTTEVELAQVLLGVNTLNSIASITRHSGLHCIELCLSETTLSEVKTRFNALDGVEVFTVANAHPRLDIPGLLVMDMDSTAIEIECIDELAIMAGVGAEVAEVTERAMQGELDFEQSLRARVAKLAGAEASIIDNLCQRLPLMPGLTEMVSELQANRWRLVLASGGFTPFVGHLKQLLNLDAAFANELVIEDGKLIGEVRGEVVDAQFKADTVLGVAAKWQISNGQRLAIGDGANDIPMVEAADFGIAFHAKPKLVAAADGVIRQLDLRVLPYMLLDLR